MKINLNKICLKKSFGQSLLVFVMLLVGVFTLSTSVKAQATLMPLPLTNWSSDGWIDGNMIFHASADIPEHSVNSIVFCNSDGGENWGSNAGSWTLNGISSSVIMDSWHDFTYVVNPATGFKAFTFKSSGYYDSSDVQNNIIKCWLIDGVNTENLILYSSPGVEWYGSWNNSYNFTYSPHSSNSLIFTYLTRQDKVVVNYSNATSTNQTILQKYNGTGYQWNELLAYYKNNTQDLVVLNASNLQTSEMRLRIFELNTQITLPPCESYTYSDWTYCSEAGHQTRTILSSNPTSCNYTDVNSAAPVLGQDCTYVAPVYPDTSLPFTIVSPFTFSYESTAKVDYTYNTDVVTPYDYIEVRRLSSDWATSTFISTSSPVANDLLHNGNSFFILPGDQEIRGRHNYEVVGYFAPYYLPGVGDMPATSSIPVVFSVYWQKTQIPTIQDIIDYEHTVSTELAHGVLYESSCTDSEWATPDPQVDFGFGVWTFPALNFTRLQCAVKLATLELGTEVIDKVTGYFTKIGNMLKNVFPFNIYTNLNESWENSAYTDVLPELSFLSPVNGNLSVQVPNGVTGSSTSFVLWGSSIFTSADTLGENNASKASLLFGAIRTIIKWALWGLFGFWVVRNGQAFVRKLTGGE